MKKIFILLITISSFSFAVAQDVVKLKNGNEMKVLVTELTSREIRYKMADLQDGPVISMPKSSAESVTFRNGVTDMLGNQNPRKYRPLGINGIFALDLSDADYALMGVGLEYFIVPQFKAELQIGGDGENGVIVLGGGKFYFNSSYSSSRLVPFIGLLAGSWDGYDFLQFPAGIDFQLKKGFTVSASLNYLDFYYDDDIVVAEIKAGWRFRL